MRTKSSSPSDSTDKIRRSRGANEALNNAALIEALDLLESDAIEAFKASALPDTITREISFLRVRALQELRATLNNWKNEGKPIG
jgi:hypothetical protein